MNSHQRRKARRSYARKMFAEHDFSKPMFSINLENGERYWPIGPLKAAPRETIVSPETLNRLHMQLAGMMK